MYAVLDLAPNKIIKTRHAKPPSLKKESWWPLNPILPAIQQQGVMIRPDPRDSQE
jgi:hypothetical protein